jgi:pimeloyl-ACP methyl ester carboxylesterase
MTRTEDFRAANEARADVARRPGRTGSGDALTRMVDAAVYRATRTPPQSAERRVLRTPGGTVRYLDTGGGGVPVLVIPGPSEDSATALARYQAIVPAGARVVRVLLPTGATPTRQADAFAALLDELDIAKAAVVASASVATTAVLLAIRYRHRVAALALIAPGHGRPPDFTQVTAPVVVAYPPGDGPLDASLVAAVRALLGHTSD